MILIRQAPKKMEMIRQHHRGNRFKWPCGGDEAPRRAKMVDLSNQQIASPVFEAKCQKIYSAIGVQSAIVRHRKIEPQT